MRKHINKSILTLALVACLVVGMSILLPLLGFWHQAKSTVGKVQMIEEKNDDATRQQLTQLSLKERVEFFAMRRDHVYFSNRIYVVSEDRDSEQNVVTSEGARDESVGSDEDSAWERKALSVETHRMTRTPYSFELQVADAVQTATEIINNIVKSYCNLLEFDIADNKNMTITPILYEETLVENGTSIGKIAYWEIYYENSENFDATTKNLVQQCTVVIDSVQKEPYFIEAFLDPEYLNALNKPATQGMYQTASISANAAHQDTIYSVNLFSKQASKTKQFDPFYDDIGTRYELFAIEKEQGVMIVSDENAKRGEIRVTLLPKTKAWNIFYR